MFSRYIMLYFIYYASFIIVVPGIILSLICQLMITIRFNKYSKVQSESGWNAHEMSDMLLERQGIRSVEIRRIRGSLTDNYNPSNDVLRCRASPGAAACRATPDSDEPNTQSKLPILLV